MEINQVFKEANKIKDPLERSVTISYLSRNQQNDAQASLLTRQESPTLDALLDLLTTELMNCVGLPEKAGERITADEALDFAAQIDQHFETGWTEILSQHSGISEDIVAQQLRNRLDRIKGHIWGLVASEEDQKAQQLKDYRDDNRRLAKVLHDLYKKSGLTFSKLATKLEEFAAKIGPAIEIPVETVRSHHKLSKPKRPEDDTLCLYARFYKEQLGLAIDELAPFLPRYILSEFFGPKTLN